MVKRIRKAYEKETLELVESRRRDIEKLSQRVFTKFNSPMLVKITNKRRRHLKNYKRKVVHTS